MLQDRLIKEMRLEEINTLEEGNAFLPKFLVKINKKFGKEPATAEDAHRPLRKEDDLEEIFTRKEKRKLSKNLTFQYQGTLYLIQTKTPNRMKQAGIEVLSKKNKEIEVVYQGKS